MKYAFLINLSLLLAFSACKNETPPTATDVVQTVQKPAGENASVVHNSVSATQSSDTVNVAKIVFEAPQHNFGEVKEGAVVNHTFKFKNTGRIPLIISDARASCGCTVPEWPKEAIPVNGEGVIKAKFNTEGKQNNQTKILRLRPTLIQTRPLFL